MKTAKIIPWIAPMISIIAGVALSGCASSRDNTMSMLSDAGFHAETPTTTQQKAGFAAMPGYQLQKEEYNGQFIYTYADKDAGVIYLGDEGSYQRLQHLAFNQQFEAVEPSQDPEAGWRNFWAPTGVL
jgi:hypothetical protein